MRINVNATAAVGHLAAATQREGDAATRQALAGIARALLAVTEEQAVANRLAYAALLPAGSPTRLRILDDLEAAMTGKEVG